ncbi:tyrosine-type recombinase/integrase [Scytonema hofmannii]|uniref:tyrosine-type recombinase/integrase n=1 Tax=Scytonema hofmannii TaxID=34078 RepID=UPI0003493028|nr:tyrosine-type recombinase/integrase [Scytonema hofmannii]
MPEQPKRSCRTVNTILSAVYVFYEYQMCLGKVAELPIYKYVKDRRTYKPFLYGIGKSKKIRKARLKLKEGKENIKTLTSEQVKQVTNACNCYRDKLLIQLLYQTGIRIGGALGLRHSDINTIFKKLEIVPREDNVNDARAKFDEPHCITGLSQGLIGLYIEYVSQELIGIDSDYVFVNLYNGAIGEPMTYNCVLSLFKRLSHQVGFYIRPHMLRHTHVTELLKDGLSMDWVQVRLKHKSVQTTIDIYGHLTTEDLTEKIDAFNKKYER